MAESRGTSDSQPKGRAAKGGRSGALLFGSWLCLIALLAAAAVYLFVLPDAGGARVAIRDTALILPIPPEDSILAAAEPETRIPEATAPAAQAEDPAQAEDIAELPPPEGEPSGDETSEATPGDATEAELQSADGDDPAATAEGEAVVVEAGANETETGTEENPAGSPESATGIQSDDNPGAVETPTEPAATTLAQVVANANETGAEGGEPQAEAGTVRAIGDSGTEAAVTTPDSDGSVITDGGQDDSAPATTPEQATPEQTAPEQTAALPQVPDPAAAVAWQRFRNPFDAPEQQPRIAVVVTGLGLADAATEAAIKLLPASVTLSFTPYARDLQSWIALARAHGHEVMLDLPMEPVTFPADDPGPQALLTTLDDQQNGERLEWILGRGSAFVGLVGNMGSRFSTANAPMTTMLKTLKQRGLLYLDNRPVAQSVGAKLADRLGVPRAINNRQIDERQASRIAIDARLAQIERIAKTEGAAVALAQPFPVSLERLSKWAAEVEERGFVLAPITAVANLQDLR